MSGSGHSPSGSSAQEARASKSQSERKSDVDEVALALAQAAEVLEHFARGEAGSEIGPEGVPAGRKDGRNILGAPGKRPPAASQGRYGKARGGPVLGAADDDLRRTRPDETVRPSHAHRGAGDELRGPDEGLGQVLRFAVECDARFDAQRRDGDLQVMHHGELAGEHVDEHPQRVLAADGRRHGGRGADPHRVPGSGVHRVEAVVKVGAKVPVAEQAGPGEVDVAHRRSRSSASPGAATTTRSAASASERRFQ